MYISLTHAVYQEKWKTSVLLFFKSKLLWKLSFDGKSLTRLQRKSEKTLVEWFWLAQVRTCIRFQSLVLKTFPSPGYFCSMGEIVLLWHFLVNLAAAQSQCFMVIGRDGGLSGLFANKSRKYLPGRSWYKI